MTEPASDLRSTRSFLEQRLRLAEEYLKRTVPNSYEQGYLASQRAGIVRALEELKAIEDRREKQRHD